MAFDNLALPFRIKQIDIAPGGIFRFHQIGVVADDFEPGAKRRVHAIWIALVCRKVFGHVLSDLRHEPAAPKYLARGLYRRLPCLSSARPRLEPASPRSAPVLLL